MLKPIIAATAFLALAGSTFVYAQQGFDGHEMGRGMGDGPHAGFHHRPSAADMTAFTDARIAALKAGLELTPDQAKNWPPFEQAVRDMVQLRMQRMQARQAAQTAQGDEQQQATASPFDRLSHRADAMAKTSAALKKVADAGTPLYASLNDEQKSRFMKLARILRPHPHMHAFMNQGWRHGEYGQGYGGGDHEGHGWGHNGQRFGQDDDGHADDGHSGPGGNMQNRMGGDGDQGSLL